MHSNANWASNLAAAFLVLGLAGLPGALAQQQIQTPAGSGGGGGSGTVTSVTCGAGLSGNTITTTGTCLVPGGGITNAMLANSTLTLGSTALTLGVTTTTVAGLTLTSPTFTTPTLGTPVSGVATNLTGTASGLTAGNVTTNANLTGPITSVGNATAIAAQTGTGSTFVMQASPTLLATTVLSQPSNSPAASIAALELHLGRTGAGGLAGGQSSADIAFQYGGAGGGYRNWISSWHDVVAATSQLKFYANNSATAGGSSAPGTGNSLGLTLDGNGSATVGGGLGIGGTPGAGNRLDIFGASSGSISLRVPAVAGSNALTLPAGTTDLSATGGANQFVAQAGAGSALTVGRVSAIIGTTTNDNAAASDVGEFFSDTANATSITTATQTNIVSRSLTAGDWECEGVVGFQEAPTTSATYGAVGISTVSATLPTQSRLGRNESAIAVTSDFTAMVTGRRRISIASTTTVYLVGYIVFTTSTMTTAGEMNCRRMR